MSWRQFLFSFKGRINRTQFWAGQSAFLCLVFLLPIVFPMRFMSNLTTASAGGIAVTLALFSLAVIYSAIVIWMCFASLTKRAHDRNKSGWWLLACNIPFLLLAAYKVAPMQFANSDVGIVLSTLLVLASSATGIWVWIETGFLAGAPSANQFGGPNQATRIEMLTIKTKTASADSIARLPGRRNPRTA